MARDRTVISKASEFFLEPGGAGHREIVEQRSRFLGDAWYASTEADARQIIRELTQHTPDANHHCWAYRVGYPVVREYWSDDGEPSGSAGKPILGAMVRIDVTNCVVVITRYFGGIKLGVRGLIETYGRAASVVLEAMPLVRRRLERRGEVVLGYDLHAYFVRRLKDLGVREEEGGLRASFAERVTLVFSVPRNEVPAVEALCEEYRGRGSVDRWRWMEEK